ncbi:hypothetical protein DFH09DRAFT_1419178 [Mycena vulgaris]|nr:hypothetical protein DFH09DRAFT_1419178 [Mycena vulgaris]
MSDSPLSVPLDGTLGTTEIGAIMGTFLLGIGSLQTFNYYQHYPNDTATLKTVVGILWFLELGHLISVWHAVYSMTVTFYGQSAHLVNPPHSLALSILFTSLIIPLVQSFFARRIRVLSGHWLITIICSVLTCLRFAFGIFLMVVFWTSRGFSILESKAHWIFTTVASLGPAVDFITAASMCYFLWKMREDGAHFKRTRRMVDKLILWTVETTTITSVAGIMQLLLFLVRKDLVWMTFYLLQPKLFSNSMLASLNNRQNLRSRIQDDVITLNVDETQTRNRVTSVDFQISRMTEITHDSEGKFPKDLEGGSRIEGHGET